MQPLKVVIPHVSRYSLVMTGINRNIGKRLSDVGHLDKLIIDILTTTVVIFISVHNYQALSFGEKITRIFL